MRVSESHVHTFLLRNDETLTLVGTAVGNLLFRSPPRRSPGTAVRDLSPRLAPSGAITREKA